MFYSRAVWLEPTGDDKTVEYEATVPCNWIKGSHVYYPNRLNVKRAFNLRQEPMDDWLRFDLVKVKLKKG